MSKIFAEKSNRNVVIKSENASVKLNILATSEFSKANEYAFQCNEDLFTSIILNQSNIFFKKVQVIDILFSHYEDNIYYGCIITKSNIAICFSYKSSATEDFINLLNVSKSVPQRIKECDDVIKYKFNLIYSEIN
jgi:hypothetical protein